MGRTRKNASLSGTAECSRPQWRICVYIRLSKEDNRNIPAEERNSLQLKSESIQNQKSILTSWIESYFEPGTYEIAGFFEDDGLTGTDDERENFMRMISTVERGEGNCIVVKTLSRAFRNYADQGYYLEEYFPSKNVRFISTMDSFVDTYTNMEAVYNLDIPMYGVLNDRFAATTSHAVRRTFDDKRSKGKFIGAFPPWGFLKDPADKNHLILDPDTAPVKVQMKDWLLHEGLSLNAVARRLNTLGIPNPAKYKQLKGWNYSNPHAKENDGLWCGTTVKAQLVSLMNLGHMVQGRQKVISYKIHDKVSMPQSEWYVVENTHEATFSREDYDALCRLFQRDTRAASNSDTVHKFAGLIKCACCQKAMHRSHCRERIYYKCRTRREKGPEACGVKSIREDRLDQAVLGAVQGLIRLAGHLNFNKNDTDNVSGSNPAADRLARLRDQKQKEFQRTQSLYDGLYSDWKLGELSESEYRRMRERYAGEMERLNTAAAGIEEELEKLERGASAGNPFLEEFLKYQNITVLNRSVLLAFIDTVYVHGNDEITIQFHLRDELLDFFQNDGLRA